MSGINQSKPKVKSHTTYTGRTPRVLRRGAAVILALAVAGCVAPAVQKDVEIGFRNPTVTLAGTTRFDVGRFAGDWQTVRCLGTCAQAARYIVATDGVFVRRAAGVDTAYLVAAPGVLRHMGGDETLVVMWVDEGFRTAAIGDANGRWAAVIKRSRRGGADQLRPAVEVLDFNGWDVSQARVIK